MAHTAALTFTQHFLFTVLTVHIFPPSLTKRKLTYATPESFYCEAATAQSAVVTRSK